MPGENEIIASVTAAQENSAFDVTQFAERTEETSDIVPVAVVTRCGTEVSILVHKDTLNDEGQLNPKLISVKDMQSIIDEHKICYVESCMYAKWIRGSVFFYSEYDATWLESDICMFGILPNGDEGYFSREQDYVECYDTNVI